MKSLLLAIFIVVAWGNTYSQTWQSFGIPEGNGITDLVYWSGGGAVFGDKLWATTGSVDWPTGQRGGVFYSATTPPYQGTWYRLGGSAGYYVGRTLEVGQDGNLYASLWRDPAQFPADALCRLSVQSATFGVLYQAQAGDNIFSIGVKNNPHTIFAGTRNGIIRSTNNGVSFGYSNSGIPDSAWVYDIAIDSSGVLAIASSKGVFISEDNGDNWLTTTGISPEDTVVTLEFVGLTNDNPTLMAGTLTGNLYKGVLELGDLPKMLIELQFVPLGNGGQGEVTAISKADEFADLFFYGLFDAIGTAVHSQKINNSSGVYASSDAGVTWSPLNDGLPPSPLVSALALKVINETSSQLYAGLFNNATNGAGIYKLSVITDVNEVSNQIPSKYKLEQNYPNPFNPTTLIQFSIPDRSFVRLEVYNSIGEKVTTLVSETLSSGTYEYEWVADDLTSGIYFYRLSTNNFSEMKKMILLK